MTIVMAVLLALQTATAEIGGKVWTWSLAEGYSVFDVTHACCTVDAQHDCAVRWRLTCAELFALPDDRLPTGCEHRLRGLRGEHIVCMGAQ